MPISTSSNRKLKIAMLGHKRIPSREGGIEIVVEELSTRMTDLGYEVTCYNRRGHHVSGDEYDREKLSEYKGVKIKNAWTIDKKGLAAVSSSIFASIAVAFSKYDVVHYHAEGPCLLCGLPKLFGKRVIATIHGLDHQRAKWGHFASWYIMCGEKSAVKHADEIIVLNKGNQEYFWEKYRRNTKLIPNGVNKPERLIPKEIKEKWNLDRDDYILFLGRIVPEKGIHYLIEAYKKIDTDKKLVIAGGVSDTSEYMNQIFKLVEGSENIILPGFVQGSLLEELYSNAYIYCLPSDLEGMPLSLLEAMSYGNACLVSDIKECADVVEDYGVTFAAGDAKDLERQLNLLCNDDNKVMELKNKASEFILSKYNWDDVVDRTLKLYLK